jgi:hypothetical protein
MSKHNLSIDRNLSSRNHLSTDTILLLFPSLKVLLEIYLPLDDRRVFYINEEYSLSLRVVRGDGKGTE